MGILESLGINECADCGQSLFLQNSYTCVGIDIDHHREVVCNDIICSKCLYRMIFKNENGEIDSQDDYCEFHFRNELSEWTITELKEVQYHGSLKETEQIVELRGRKVDEIIQKLINEKVKERKIKKKKEKEEKIRMAKKLNIAGRYEESALLYEELEMWEEAGKVRKKEKVSVTKIIHINANDLFNQIKREGLAIPYKCPNCSGTLKIDGVRIIEKCPYCGTDIDMKTLSSLVDTLLT